MKQGEPFDEEPQKPGGGLSRGVGAVGGVGCAHEDDLQGKEAPVVRQRYACTTLMRHCFNPHLEQKGGCKFVRHTLARHTFPNVLERHNHEEQRCIERVEVQQHLQRRARECRAKGGLRKAQLALPPASRSVV